MISYDEVTQKKKLNFNDVDLQSASIYSGEDVYITWELYKKHKEEEEQGTKTPYPPLLRSQENFSVLYDIEIPLIDVLKDMEIT